MFTLDENFLQDIGLSDLPEDQKTAFLAHIYTSLEERVGMQLSEGLSSEQFDEFEAIIDKDMDRISAWLQANDPSYSTSEGFLKFQQGLPEGSNTDTIVAEYAASKWIEKNRPNYKQVVSDTLQELRNEIMQNRDQIVSAATE